VNGSLALVGFDTGVFVEGLLRIRIGSPPSFSYRIMAYAKAHAFAVLVLQGVLDEFEEVLSARIGFLSCRMNCRTS